MKQDARSSPERGQQAAPRSRRPVSYGPRAHGECLPAGRCSGASTAREARGRPVDTAPSVPGRERGSSCVKKPVDVSRSATVAASPSASPTGRAHRAWPSPASSANASPPRCGCAGARRGRGVGPRRGRGRSARPRRRGRALASAARARRRAVSCAAGRRRRSRPPPTRAVADAVAGRLASAFGRPKRLWIATPGRPLFLAASCSTTFPHAAPPRRPGEPADPGRAVAVGVVVVDLVARRRPLLVPQQDAADVSSGRG
jgi:hypothetical protein